MLFFMLLIVLTVTDYYLKDRYFEFTDGEGRDLAETFLYNAIILSSTFALAFLVILKTKKEAKKEVDYE